MKTLISCIFALLFCVLTHDTAAAEAVSNTIPPTFTIQEGYWVWHFYSEHQLDKTYASFQAFERALCKENNVLESECTEEFFKNIKAGTSFKVPSSSSGSFTAEASVAKETVSLKEVVSELERQLQTAHEENTRMQKKFAVVRAQRDSLAARILALTTRSPKRDNPQEAGINQNTRYQSQSHEKSFFTPDIILALGIMGLAIFVFVALPSFFGRVPGYSIWPRHTTLRAKLKRSRNVYHYGYQEQQARTDVLAKLRNGESLGPKLEPEQRKLGGS